MLSKEVVCLLRTLQSELVLTALVHAVCRYSPLCIDAATIMLGVAEGRAAVLNALEMSPKGPVPAPLLPTSQPVKEAVKVIAQSRKK